MANKTPSTTEQPTPAPRRLRRPVEKTYFIVNPAGAIHEVSKEHAQERLRDPRFRIATAEEVASLKEQGGDQFFDQPIAKPWSPVLDDDAELD